jgi:hypothetical protein
MKTRRVVYPTNQVAGATRCAVTDTMLRNIYTNMAFFYRKRLDAGRLERALARVLSDFPTFAGQLVDAPAGLEIRHTARGVRFEVEETEEAISELEDQGRARSTRRFDPPVSSLRVLLGKELLLVIRVLLARDGTVLSVGVNHALGDLQTVMLFMRAWSRAYDDKPHEPPAQVCDRDAYLSSVMPDPPNAQPVVRLNTWAELVRAAYAILKPARLLHFELDWPDIHAIHASMSDQLRLSVNDALCARIFWALRSLAGLRTPTNLCLTVNYRKRVGIPENVPGNLVTMIGHTAEATHSAADIAAGLRSQLEAFATKHVDYHATKRVYDAHPAPRERARIAPSMFTPGKGDHLVYNWNNFGVYEVEIGGERPSLFCSLSRIMSWSMIIYDLPRQAGYGIRIALPPSVARKLETCDIRSLLLPQLAGR